MKDDESGEPVGAQGGQTSYFISQAVVWAGVILGCSLTLEGDAFADIIPILGLGAVVSLLIIPAVLFRSSR